MWFSITYNMQKGCPRACHVYLGMPWKHMAVIKTLSKTLRRPRLQDCEFQANLSYISKTLLQKST